MSEKRIVFLPYKLHFRHLLFALANHVQVTVMLPPRKLLPENTKLEGVRIKYREFGINILKRFMYSEVRTLKYVPGLSKLLDRQNIGALVACEFYHWYTLQCISYKKHHPDLKLFVISETKRWPRNVFAHLFKRILLFYVRMNIKHIDGIFVYTQTAKEFLTKHAPEFNVELLPVPTNIKLFKPSERKLFCADGCLRLLMNARYSTYKRHKDIFLAISNLQKKGLKVHLTCIGRGEKGKESVVRQVQHMGLEDVVDFLDPLPQEQLPELYHSHDVLVLPSYNEAIGMVVPEAMACGILTITSDTVGANVYVAEGETGFIHKTGDVEELTKALEKCFDVKLLERMGGNAHTHIMNNFTPEALASRFYSLLRYSISQ